MAARWSVQKKMFAPIEVLITSMTNEEYPNGLSDDVSALTATISTEQKI